MYSGVARSSYRQHSCDDVTKLGLCDWFTNELTDWRRRRRRRKEITYETLGLHLVQKFKISSANYIQESGARLLFVVLVLAVECL